MNQRYRQTGHQENKTEKMVRYIPLNMKIIFHNIKLLVTLSPVVVPLNPLSLLVLVLVLVILLPPLLLMGGEILAPPAVSVTAVRPVPTPAALASPLLPDRRPRPAPVSSVLFIFLVSSVPVGAGGAFLSLFVFFLPSVVSVQTPGATPLSVPSLVGPFRFLLDTR